MANASYSMDRIVIDVTDKEITHLYILCNAAGDCPLGVQGWHYKAFPARIPAAELLKAENLKDVILWPLKAPE